MRKVVSTTPLAIEKQKLNKKSYFILDAQVAEMKAKRELERAKALATSAEKEDPPPLENKEEDPPALMEEDPPALKVEDTPALKEEDPPVLKEEDTPAMQEEETPGDGEEQKKE